MAWTRDRQLKALLSTGTGKFLNRFSLLLVGFLVLAVASVARGVATGEFGYYMLAAIIALALCWGGQTAPHVHNAVKGVTEGTRRHGEIEITIEECSDCSDTYYVTVISGCSPSWKFEFIPTGWRPAQEKTEAELVFIPGVEWPVLILTAKGIMHPRFTPKVADGVNLRQAPPPQQPDKRPLSCIVLPFGILFFAVGCIGAGGGWSAYRLDTGIEKSGPRAEGHVTGKTYFPGPEGTEFRVEYWFSLPSGERVDGTHRVPKELWKTLYKGKTFVVVYSAKDPKRNFPLGRGVTSLGFTVFLSALFAACASVGALMIVVFFRAARP